MNRAMSVLGQPLQLFPRHELHRLATEDKAECRAGGFACWGHFGAMRFCRLDRAKPLHEMGGGLACAGW